MNTYVFWDIMLPSPLKLNQLLEEDMSPTSSKMKGKPGKKQHEAVMKKSLKMEQRSNSEILVGFQQTTECSLTHSRS
jgi:hypothetical protein